MSTIENKKTKTCKLLFTFRRITKWNELAATKCIVWNLITDKEIRYMSLFLIGLLPNLEEIYCFH